MAISWYKADRWEIYEELASEAAYRLRNSLIPLPDVTNVTVAGGGTLYVIMPAVELRELVLYVCTALPGNTHLATIPSKFLGFAVNQVHLGDRRQAYLRTWIRFFAEMSGWDSAKTLEWAKAYDVSLRGGNDIPLVYDHGPIKIAVEAFVADHLKKTDLRAGKDRLRLRNDILSVIEEANKNAWPEGYYHPDTIPDFDWTGVKQRVARLVFDYTQEGPNG